MCGITGILHFDSERLVDKDVLKRMADSLIHRGPDAEGFYVNKNIGLGHRRLSIIDLTTGDQPMYSDDRNLVLVHNGEIYNYIELREELKTLGYKFKTDSDTEVIIKSYEEWGIECQVKFNGMWAFALWNERKQELFLSIDRIGEKPLYYAIHENSLIFGSEIKALLSYGVQKETNIEVLDIYLALSYVPAPYTFYKNINKLSPGHYTLIGNNDIITPKKYWDLPDIDETNMLGNEKEIFDQFESLFRDAVKIRMRSDVPYGAFLSGGLDSSSVVSIMSEISSKPVQTYTIGFKEKIFDERHLARDVAVKFQTDHNEHLVEPGSFDESLKRILHHYDEPFGDSSAIPTGYVSNYARQDVKMVLTGDGGDEVLSGYLIYLAEKLTLYYQYIPIQLRKAIIPLLDRLGSMTSGNLRYSANRLRNACYGSMLPFQTRLAAKQMWANSSVREALITDKSQIIPVQYYIADVFSNCTYSDDFYKLMYFHLKVSLPADMLVKVDRMSMAYSLETRLPFLDHRLIEFMVKVSKSVKLKGLERKTVLRNTIGKQLPKSILNAPKKGFGVPLREWFKDKEFESRLSDLSKADFGLNGKVIDEIVQDNREGKRDYGNFIWMLFVLKEWTLNSNN
ncbi:MAG: asparagine synthase (glutamine-hydrolyzing) [Bacteroidetes bacterium]|nr:asparagine synthase (glutamine-hydrolyzing) [Bacteroidia bacterium]PCH66386.1 MAG: asparagine synthase (glutamine-hydrolyzing) [Bacteroidota bacterium]